MTQGWCCRALVLASMEVKFHVDPDTDTVVDIVAKQHLETMSMVEEFMLLANVTSAECTLKVRLSFYVMVSLC